MPRRGPPQPKLLTTTAIVARRREAQKAATTALHRASGDVATQTLTHEQGQVYCSLYMEEGKLWQEAEDAMQFPHGVKRRLAALEARVRLLCEQAEAFRQRRAQDL
jgi:hypothetical protein